jgi:hypothetical protein
VIKAKIIQSFSDHNNNYKVNTNNIIMDNENSYALMFLIEPKIRPTKPNLILLRVQGPISITLENLTDNTYNTLSSVLGIKLIRLGSKTLSDDTNLQDYSSLIQNNSGLSGQRLDAGFEDWYVNDSGLYVKDEDIDVIRVEKHLQTPFTTNDRKRPKMQNEDESPKIEGETEREIKYIRTFQLIDIVYQQSRGHRNARNLLYSKAYDFSRDLHFEIYSP